MSTIWGQGCNFNAQCPYTTDGPCYRSWAGCPTIALVQIMKYHEHPTSFDWSAMPDVGATAETAALIRTVGDAIGIHWGGNSSGLSPDEQEDNIPAALKNTFGYNPFVRYIDYFGNHEKVIDELNHNRPVYMRGGTKDYWAGIILIYGGGHAWVCDGYLKNIYPNGSSYLHLHMNWGWLGDCDGWYAFNNFNPIKGGEEQDFNFYTGCIIGIQP